MLKRLNKVNDIDIFSVFDSNFITYGKIIDGFDFSELIHFIKHQTVIPESGNVYVASVVEMERYSTAVNLSDIFYGGMPIQIGYCNGRNSTYNGFEYHKGSEINIAVTDFMLVLGHVWEINENSFEVENANVFYVPKGTSIELYATTLHLSPCKTSDEGYKNIVVLPYGTNTPLEHKPFSDNAERELLLQKNKWVISHKDREPLISQGAYPGLMGINKELYY